MSINSHIQVPNFILKNFRNSVTQRVFHLDCTQKRICSCSSVILGVEYGYYSDEIESLLNKTVESPFSSLVASVNAFINSNQESINIPLTMEEVSKKYVSSAMYRSNLAYEILMKNSYAAPFVPPQKNHDIIVCWGVHHNNGILPQLIQHKMTVLVNKTKENFVVPRNCFYEASSNNVKCIIAPISPKCAICLSPQKYFEGVTEDDISRLEAFNDSSDVILANIYALKSEFAFNRSFIAAAEKPELEKLLDYIGEHENELNKLHEDASSFK